MSFVYFFVKNCKAPLKCFVEIVSAVNPLLLVNFWECFLKKNRLKLVGLAKNKHSNMVPKSVKVNDSKKFNGCI